MDHPVAKRRDADEAALGFVDVKANIRAWAVGALKQVGPERDRLRGNPVLQQFDQFSSEFLGIIGVKTECGRPSAQLGFRLAGFANRAPEDPAVLAGLFCARVE